MIGKNLAASLKQGKYVFGTAMVSRLDAWWPSILASLKMDLAFIDSEHTPADRQPISTTCHLYRAHGVVPVVRIPSPDPYQATMALDGGALGVIGPYVESAEQVQKLAGAVKYKPLKGKRLEDFLSNKAGLEPGLLSYLEKTNEENVLIVNLESVPALDNLDEILSVKGLDAVLVGPHDLTCSLGIPEQYDHPLFKESIEFIIRKSREAGVGVGVHTWEEVGFDNELDWARKGANLIMHSNDLSIFTHAISGHLNLLRQELQLSTETNKVHDANI